MTALIFTPEQINALRKRGKLTKELRATLMVVQKHPYRNEYLVHEPGHDTHVVTQSTTRLYCDCKAQHQDTCSHRLAIPFYLEKSALERRKAI